MDKSKNVCCHRHICLAMCSSAEGRERVRKPLVCTARDTPLVRPVNSFNMKHLAYAVQSRMAFGLGRDATYERGCNDDCRAPNQIVGEANSPSSGFVPIIDRSRRAADSA
jgi:hypothetical protein